MRTFRLALVFLAMMFFLNWAIAESFAGGYGSQVTSANVVLNDLGSVGYCMGYAAPAQLNVVARQVTPATFTLMPYQPQAQLPAIQPPQPVYVQPTSTVQFQLSQPTYSYSAALVQPQVNAYSYSHSFSQNLNAGGYGGFSQNVRFNQVGGHGLNQRFNQRLNVRANVRANRVVRQQVVAPVVNRQVTKTKTVNRTGLLGRQVSKTKTVVKSR